MFTRISAWTLVVCMLVAASANAISHTPLRTAPPASKRPLGKGPNYFVDAAKGNDAAAGTQAAPWKTVNRAMKQLKAGDTLVLRGGTYYEHVYCAVVGTKDKPVTIRSYPGEQAVIDGGWREFFENPATAWEPVKGEAPGEFKSTKAYPNARDVFGTFGDSMIGMSTYYHNMDLVATNELWDWADWDQRKTTDCKPLYCGPGLWYNQATGAVHVRLSHTNLPEPVDNYKGETDPRKLPLIIAPFRSVPLMIDHAQHLVVQDLTVRGGGYDVVIVDYAENLTLDNVTIWSGSYGIRLARTVGMLMTDCGVYGNCPPWLARSDTSKRAYPGRPFRDITRLNTHATLVIDNGREFSVFAAPVNDDWDIAYCEFTDSHDGPYLGGVSMKFHNNLITNTQDDGIYLSQMYPRHIYGGGGATLRIYENYFGKLLTALAFGGMHDTGDKIFIYRNIVDQRDTVYTGRPNSKNPAKAGTSTGKLMGDHGSPPWPEMTFYHNTIITAQTGRFAQSLLGSIREGKPRTVYNNLCIALKGVCIPQIYVKEMEGWYKTDGNLYWSPNTPIEKATAILKKMRKVGGDENAVLGDPKLKALPEDAAKAVDISLQAGSAAIDAGVPLPADWDDPLRAADKGKPDIGALPAGAEMFTYGRRTR